MPDSKKTCFVVMGFGKKTDYQTGRVLDLDKSYQYIIKPAAEEAGLDCKRADEIIHSGLIDVPMYEYLLTADVVIADISTSNANALYELGVRHALRPYTTITIAEDKMVFPFDVSHLAVRRYRHLGEGIDFAEVMRMKKELTEAIGTILQKPEKDSPVYAFFSDLDPPARRKIEAAVAQSSPAAVTAAASESDASNPTMKVLMDQANAAIANNDFETAKTLLNLVRPMAPRDPYVVQRLAFVTFKSKQPDELRALQAAGVILAELNPEISTDTETLGLWSSIHKRSWELTRNPDDLTTAILACEKGFYLKNDEYNGINLAFLYDLRASVSEGAEAAADRVLAARIRRRVLPICETLLAATPAAGAERQFWALVTLAQAHIGLGCEAKARELLDQARALHQPKWMMDSTEQQLAALEQILAT
ncbi:tetratricopeptide repeat-containing protein [Nevskia soli]|uniref:tetratricopeptide repeat-containing protein n=1 Tax=Nevskia soli TaxID=418856 RepID=UPI0015D6BBAC|nr:tetratricopeptide repeat-containing protein [Nevskia soli]